MNTISKNKVVVGISGGVDSAITLALLKDQGLKPIALHLQIPIWNKQKNIFEINKKQNDTNLKIIKDICKKLDIKYKILDTSKDFEKKVISYFKKEYSNYRTPNPCTFCNKKFKFKHILNFANKNNIYYIATGHYAQIKPSENNKIFKLIIAKDSLKDQTYGLCLLTQETLKRIKFPLGQYTKQKVYEFAEKYNFNMFKKEKQSQDICFLKNSNLKEFLNKNLKPKIGNIIDNNNNIIGQHKGLHFYTIGQRRGLGLNKLSYVKNWNKNKNQLFITTNKDEIIATEINLINFSFTNKKNIPKKDTEVFYKIRYKQNKKKCIIKPPKQNKLKVIFKEPQKLVACGQYCVFYKNKECLGGGIIDNYN